MSILQLSGHINVKVLPADIEAICLKKPKAVKDFPRHLQAIAAALDIPDVKAFSDQCDKHGYCLSYDNGQPMENGEYELKFNIIKRKKFEVISHGA